MNIFDKVSIHWQDILFFTLFGIFVSALITWVVWGHAIRMASVSF